MTHLSELTLDQYLAGYSFVNYEEIVCAVCDWIEEDTGSLFFSDCAKATDLANARIEKHDIYFDDDENIIDEEEYWKRQEAEDVLRWKWES